MLRASLWEVHLRRSVPLTTNKSVISSAPEFIVMASADPESAPLQRLQIVKGWIDADGTHEKVIDVACAGAGRSEFRNKPLP